MAMKSEEEIRLAYKNLWERFDKYGREPARIDINGPRALMQMDMEAEERTLKWVLGIK